MSLTDLLPIPEPEWTGIEVYEMVKREVGPATSDRLWRTYKHDVERAAIWFDIRQAVMQQLYEKAIDDPVFNKLRGPKFLGILKANLERYYPDIARGVERVIAQRRGQ